MQIAPTALISFSISTNVTALQACYGFTMGWVINFCELHIRHLIMPFINKCHPRYLLGEVNKLNVQLSALCKSILTAHCIFSLVCLSRRTTAEITMANKGIWGTIICTPKPCFSHRCWWQELCHCLFPAWGHSSGSLGWPPFRAAQDPWEQESWSALQILTPKEFGNHLLAFISVCDCPPPQSQHLPVATVLITSWADPGLCFSLSFQNFRKGGWGWVYLLTCPHSSRSMAPGENEGPSSCLRARGGRAWTMAWIFGELSSGKKVVRW